MHSLNQGGNLTQLLKIIIMLNELDSCQVGYSYFLAEVRQGNSGLGKQKQNQIGLEEDPASPKVYELR